jgi:hypothetical protein
MPEERWRKVALLVGAYGIALAAYLTLASLNPGPRAALGDAIFFCFFVGWQAAPFSMVGAFLWNRRAWPLGAGTALAIATVLTVWVFHDVTNDPSSTASFAFLFTPPFVAAAAALPLVLEWLARRLAGRRY